MKCLSYLLLLISLSAFAQAKTVRNDSILIWNEYERLSWNDFLATKKHLTGWHDPYFVQDASAILCISIDFLPTNLNCKNIDDILIVAVVNRKKSIAIIKSDEILSHEITHFDIAELYARKMRKAIENILEEENNECNLQKIADTYYQLSEEQWQTQMLYDNEIRFKGEEKKNQRKWDRKVDSLLTIYKDYKQEISLEDLEFY